MILDVRHGKAIFAGVGVGNYSIKQRLTLDAGRNHADVVNKAEDK